MSLENVSPYHGLLNSLRDNTHKLALTIDRIALASMAVEIAAEELLDVLDNLDDSAGPLSPELQSAIAKLNVALGRRS